MSILSTFAKILKPAEIRHAIGRLLAFSAPRSTIDYAGAVGDLLHASVVMAPVQFIQRAAHEARFRVVRETDDGDIEEVDHPLVELMDRPNESYSGAVLLDGVIYGLCAMGNAYWQIARNGRQAPAQLWLQQTGTIEPKWPRDGSAFLSHYEYRPGNGAAARLEIEDVVHFRYGTDPRNTRLGMSPVMAALREVYIDMQASAYSAGMLTNHGRPGLLIAPKREQSLTDDEAAAIKKWVREEFAGDRAGTAVVMTEPTEISQFSFDPSKMAIPDVRNVAEERVCALLGIPSAVVGFGSGLEQTKVGATMGELAKLAWQNGINPILIGIADEITRSLLSIYPGSEGLRADFDVSRVAAMQDDKNREMERAARGFGAAILTRGEARRIVGEEAEDADDVYLQQFALIEVPAGQPTPPRPDPAPMLMPPEDDEGKARRRGGQKAAIDAATAFIAAQAAALPTLADVLERRLVRFFDGLGDDAAAIAETLMAEMGEAAARPGETKDAGTDRLLIERILDALGLTSKEALFRQLIEAHFLTVAENVGEQARSLGLAIALPDPVARAVVAEGGRRAGLIDLAAQTKDALFETIEQGRAEGLGAPQLARRIREVVPAGPWRTSSIRGKVIARTETKFAQNVSTLAMARDAGAQFMVVRDGLLGPDVAAGPNPALPGVRGMGHFDRNNVIVRIETAERMAAEEHPNGTLGFAPFFGDIEDAGDRLAE